MDEGARRPGSVGIAGLEQLERIGQGGAGTVYRARQPQFNREVAVKVISAPLLDDQARRRFDRELQALGALSGHPNIVTVHSAGFTDEGRPYIVMALEPGGSLADLVARRGTLPWREAVDLGLQVGRAVEAAHEAGIIHRDVKPENVLMSRWNEPRLADFGIARVRGMAQTATGRVTASLLHAAPEVLAGQRPTPASDVYSLTSTIYFLILGHAPFEGAPGESLLALTARIGTRPPPDLGHLGVPGPVEAVLRRAMSKNPWERPPTARELVAALTAALFVVAAPPAAAAAPPPPAPGPPPGHAPSAPLIPPPPAPFPPAAPPAPPRTPIAGAAPSRTAAMVAVGVAALLIAGSVALVVLLTRRSDSVTGALGGSTTASPPAFATAPPSTAATPPPTPAQPEPLTADQAAAAVAARGYDVTDTSTYHPNARLHVLLGTARGSADGTNMYAFFFDQSGLTGTDTLNPSGHITVDSQTDDTVTLRYTLWRPADPQCCPTGGSATVRYRYVGVPQLQPLDPIPDDGNVPLSRR